MGLCSSKPSVAGSPVAGSPEHYLTHTTEQTTPLRLHPPRRPCHPACMAWWHSALRERDGIASGSQPYSRTKFSRRPTSLVCDSAADPSKTRATVNALPTRQRRYTRHETRLALHRGRGNVDSDLRLSNGRSATYSSLSYCLGENDENLLAGSALAAGAGNCDHNAAINARRHAVRMEDGGQMMNVRDYEQTHLYALYQPPSSAEAEESPVVLDSWGDGPAVLLRDSHWAETYGTSTNVIERFDKRDAIDALARTTAFRAEIEDPQTDLHANARDLETAFLANPAPGDIFSAMPVIAPELAQSTRQRLQEYSPRTRQALAADAARQAYGLDNAQPISPRTTAAILEDAERLDALGRPPLSW
ncbi:XopE/AvrPphe family type III secretion system effector [Xanthomonas campestris pv. olitorii]|nr:XopE/AvrPphe family type III secretion system effector [Xanthomonas campestris pv. olitorii]WVK03994.1 XopE/AvrPphe family type III secretion system effector [Xanthomonas campestris pv. olitorii]